MDDAPVLPRRDRRRAEAVFEDPAVAAVATWEPMLSEIVANTSRKGSKVLLSSADFNGPITDVVTVNKSDYEANREKYSEFMRGIYRAVDLYNNDEAAFLAAACSPTPSCAERFARSGTCG